MSFKYEQQLEDIIARQKEEVTRLLEKNAEMQGLNDTICEETVEQARTKGQEEAWELARKCMLMTDREREAIFGSGHNTLYGVLTYFDYKHATAKVAEWEQKKEEICVGDVLLSNKTNMKCTVTHIGCELITILWNDGSCSNKTKNLIKERFKKIGHIDVASMLAQIGEEELNQCGLAGYLIGGRGYCLYGKKAGENE